MLLAFNMCIVTEETGDIQHDAIPLFGSFAKDTNFVFVEPRLVLHLACIIEKCKG